MPWLTTTALVLLAAVVLRGVLDVLRALRVSRRFSLAVQRSVWCQETGVVGVLLMFFWMGSSWARASDPICWMLLAAGIGWTHAWRLRTTRLSTIDYPL